jgi:hypothetical protein
MGLHSQKNVKQSDYNCSFLRVYQQKTVTQNDLRDGFRFYTFRIKSVSETSGW